jgi:hypothetical protein
MDFYAVLDDVIALLRSRRRVSYGALKRQFGLDDAYLDDLKIELRPRRPARGGARLSGGLCQSIARYEGHIAQCLGFDTAGLREARALLETLA